jgi:hypothetical protein
MKQHRARSFLLLSLFFSFTNNSFAGTDTLRVMAYNVLYYGNGCQGPNQLYHDYLKTIVGYANPDILSLEKMASIPVSREDKFGTAPFGFEDSILNNSLNVAFPGRYAYCPLVNTARSSSMSMLFYDQRKLGYICITCSYANITDFTTYKFYYKSPDLAVTHDTTFLYVIPIHTRSGDDNERVRGVQIGEAMKYIREHFVALPNMIKLGDFNSRNSEEPFYKLLTANNDSNFQFFDPPFFPDKKLKYPADWDHNAEFSGYMTTSTRESADIPNSCGTGGGAKNWYDHIFLSSSIIHHTNRIRYIPNSYKTIGNDGQRFGISINNRNAHQNASAPDNVIEALYQMSNKYPVMLSIEVATDSILRKDREIEKNAGKVFYKNEVSVTGPVNDILTLYFPGDMLGQDITMTIADEVGNIRVKKKFKVQETKVETACKVPNGDYILRLVGHHNLVAEQKFKKE